MKKIVVLTGSPHHPGTSEKLADAFVKGAQESGNQVYRFDAGRRVNEFSLIQLQDNHSGAEVEIEPDDIIKNEVIPHFLTQILSFLSVPFTTMESMQHSKLSSIDSTVIIMNCMEGRR